MRLDLHIHSRELSPCASASEEEQIRAAMAAGLDVIAFTNHHRLVPAEHLADLNGIYAPLRIYGGVELTIDGEDLLVIGVHDPALESNHWNYPELHTFVRERNGLLILAHPFRYHPRIDLDLLSCPPDAIEIHSCNTPASYETEIRETALGLHVPVVSNSDAHVSHVIGSYYNIVDAPPDERIWFDCLRRGELTLFGNHSHAK